MDEEEYRRRRLEELRAQQAAAAQNPAAAPANAQTQADAQDAQARAMDRLLQQILEPEARERLTRIRLSRPELAVQVANQLASLAQSGRLARRLTDADLKTVLGHLTPQDRDTKITRK